MLIITNGSIASKLILFSVGSTIKRLGNSNDKFDKAMIKANIVGKANTGTF